jgi:hypothetical protein
MQRYVNGEKMENKATSTSELYTTTHACGLYARVAYTPVARRRAAMSGTAFTNAARVAYTPVARRRAAMSGTAFTNAASALVCPSRPPGACKRLTSRSKHACCSAKCFCRQLRAPPHPSTAIRHSDQARNTRRPRTGSSGLSPKSATGLTCLVIGTVPPNCPKYACRTRICKI